MLCIGGTLGCSAHRLAITAVERERDTDLLTIVAGDLEPIGTPAGIALVDGDAAIVAPLLAPSAVTLEQQPVHLHHAVDTLGIMRGAPGFLRVAAEQSMNAAVSRRLAGRRQAAGCRQPSPLTERHRVADLCLAPKNREPIPNALTAVLGLATDAIIAEAARS
jgi:hypothetical protein